LAVHAPPPKRFGAQEAATARAIGVNRHYLRLFARLIHALDLTRPAMNRERDGPAANRAIFYQRLLGLRRVDLQWKRLSAMRTSD
jgi:hypothetical protein